MEEEIGHRVQMEMKLENFNPKLQSNINKMQIIVHWYHQ